MTASVIQYQQLFNSRIAADISNYTQDDLQHFLSDEDELTLYPIVFKTTISVLPTIDIQTVIYEYSLDNKNSLLIMVNRTDHKQIIGYIRISFTKWDFYNLKEVIIFSGYENLGFKIDLLTTAILFGKRLICQIDNTDSVLLSQYLSQNTILSTSQLNKKTGHKSTDLVIFPIDVSERANIYFASTYNRISGYYPIDNLHSDITTSIAFRRWLTGNSEWKYNSNSMTSFLNTIMQTSRIERIDSHKHPSSHAHSTIPITGTIPIPSLQVATITPVGQTAGTGTTTASTTTVSLSVDTSSYETPIADDSDDYSFDAHNHRDFNVGELDSLIQSSTEWMQHYKLQEHNLDWSHLLNWIFSVNYTKYGIVGQP